MKIWLGIILIVVALFAGYLYGDYSAYSNLQDIVNTQNAIVSGKGWGIFKFAAKSGSATATV